MAIPAQVTVPSPEPDPDFAPGPFEGPEKLLELWFAPSLDTLPDIPESSSRAQLRTRPCGIQSTWRGVRRVPREVWEEMLEIVKCKVLSVVEGEELDAYLLRWVIPVQSVFITVLMRAWEGVVNRRCSWRRIC